MLKLMFFIIFLIPLIYKFWFIQSMLFIFCFILLFSNYMNDFCLLGYLMGVDLISLGFIILSVWISSLMIMASLLIYKNSNYKNGFILMVLFLLMFLFLSFSMMNFLLFYLFFECTLIPTLILIFGWGYQPERLISGFYLMFYTLIASLPLLMSIFYLFKFNGTCMFMIKMSYINSFFIYLGLIMAFLVKLPMFMFHFWLPKAHVEAPISGSMILAGILLKLGGYGLFRVMNFVPGYFICYNYIWIVICMYGGLFISMICLVQVDIKSLIAYSSVAHMSLVIMGTMTMFMWGCSGSYLLMLGHGLCSSGLFCLSNIMYERLLSRSFFISKGMMNFMPSMTLMWFLFCSCNMASPPSLNLIGEIMIINSILSWCSMSMFFLMLMSFMSACYSFYLFSYSQHGFFYSGYYSFSYGYVREYLLLMMHWLPLNLFVLKMDLLMIN